METYNILSKNPLFKGIEQDVTHKLLSYFIELLLSLNAYVKHYAKDQSIYKRRLNKEYRNSSTW